MAIDPAAVALYLGSTVSSAKIAQACADAPFLMDQYGVTEADTDADKYQFLGRLMVCHLLCILGINPVILSKAVGDVSVSQADIPRGTDKGMTPFLWEFIKFVDRSEFPVSV